MNIAVVLGDTIGPTDWAPDSGNYIIGSAPLTVLEICNDGIDNDRDGLIDCKDPDCNADPSCVAATVITADFSASPTNGTAPLTVSFFDASRSSSVAISGWQWDFGDGLFDTVQNPVHIYKSSGLFTVTLTVKDSLGNRGSITKPGFISVSSGAEPVADFTAAPIKGPAPLDVQFTDLSTSPNGAIVSWSWDFGDGNFDRVQNPFHTYAFSGLFGVNLEVTDASGGFASVFKPDLISVESPGQPIADFTASPRTGLPPLKVLFSDLSSSPNGAIVGWFWDFGDGELAQEQNPIHVYTFSGFFSVSLEVKDVAGEFGFVNKFNFIIATRPKPPVARFNASPLEGFVPLDVTFTDLSTSPNGAIIKWFWDFGDGGTSIEGNPLHTYEFAGLFSVGLEVVDELDKSGFIFKRNLINVTEEGAPQADFTASLEMGFTPLEVQFTDTSFSPNGLITQWKWGFGDGGFADIQNPLHIYDSPGFFTVSLDIIDVAGKMGSISKPDFIRAMPGNAPFADFITEPDPPTGNAPANIQFLDISQSPNGSIVSWAWLFGDGGFSDQQSPSHTYNFPGIFTVELKVIDSAGQSAFVSRPNLVTVSEGEGQAGVATSIVIRLPFDPTFSEHPKLHLHPLPCNLLIFQRGQDCKIGYGTLATAASAMNRARFIDIRERASFRLHLL